MGKDTKCEKLCTVSITDEQSNEVKQLIKDEYRVEW